MHDSISQLINRHRNLSFIYPSELLEYAAKLEESKKNSKKKSVFIPNYELTGVKGQYALSKILGVPYDDVIHFGGDDGIDAVYQGSPIQIKSTTYLVSRDGELPHLIFFLDDPLKCEYYILTIIRNNQVTLAGWLHLYDVLVRRKIKDGFPPSATGETKRYVIPVKALNDSIFKA